VKQARENKVYHKKIKYKQVKRKFKRESKKDIFNPVHNHGEHMLFIYILPPRVPLPKFLTSTSSGGMVNVLNKTCVAKCCFKKQKGIHKETANLSLTTHYSFTLNSRPNF
jgi:hypothetical protein